MGFYLNKGHFFDVDDFSLQHKEDEEEKESSDSGRAEYGTANSTTKEKGTDGKLNNSSEYNHDYYMANKEKWKEGDSDFDESNYNENNLIPGTDLYSFQRKDGSRVVLFEDNKWVLPKGSKLDDATTKRLQTVFSGKKLTDKDADKITAALNEGKDKKASSEKKEEKKDEKSSKKSGGSSKKSSSGGSKKKSSGSKGKKSSGSKKKSSDGSSKKSSSSGSKKKSSSSKKSSSDKTEEEKKAEEEKKIQEEQKAKQEAEAYQKQLAEQQAQKEAQQKQQEEQNATGDEYTEEELKEASKKSSTKKTSKKKKTTTTQNAQYTKHFDEHGAIIRYFGGRY